VFKYIIYDIVNVPSHLLYRIYHSVGIIKPVQFVIINIIIYICFFVMWGLEILEWRKEREWTRRPELARKIESP
jgi:hypothetical protein